MSEQNNCPCGSGKPFALCCEPVIGGQAPAMSAEALMRSRYTAFTLNDYAYLENSWHPDTRQPVSENKDDLDTTQWIGLRILNCKQGKPHHTQGSVTFLAKFSTADGEHSLCEKSSFKKVDGRWYYYKGEPSRAPVENSKTNRNAACPCGSGKKFKHCCGN